MCKQKKDGQCARPDFLKNGEINLFASQPFRQEETKCSNAPQNPIHKFCFNAYVSSIAHLNEKSKRTKAVLLKGGGSFLFFRRKKSLWLATLLCSGGAPPETPPPKFPPSVSRPTPYLPPTGGRGGTPIGKV